MEAPKCAGEFRSVASSNALRFMTVLPLGVTDKPCALAEVLGSAERHDQISQADRLLMWMGSRNADWGTTRGGQRFSVV
jgi:hypothetical protein